MHGQDAAALADEAVQGLQRRWRDRLGMVVQHDRVECGQIYARQRLDGTCMAEADAWNCLQNAP